MSLQNVFAFCAIAGGVLLAVQLVLQFKGAGGGDAPGDLDAGDVDVGPHGSADLSFRILSMQGLSAFLTMFGLVGLGIARGTPQSWSSDQSAMASLGAGLAAGFGTSWVLARLFKVASSLQSSGTLDLNQAVGVTGTVYLTIKKDKPGKVTVTVSGRMLTLDAIVDGDIVLETGSSCRITRVLPGDQVVVAKA